MVTCPSGINMGCYCTENELATKDKPYAIIRGDRARPRGSTGQDWVYYLLSKASAIAPQGSLYVPGCVFTSQMGEVHVSRRLAEKRPEVAKEIIECAAGIPGVMVELILEDAE